MSNFNDEAGRKLARAIVNEYRKPIERDEEIDGSNAVDFIVDTLYPLALKTLNVPVGAQQTTLDDLLDRIEAAGGVRALHEDDHRHDIMCPKCFGRSINVCFESTCEIHSDGAGDAGDITWDGSSPASCNNHACDMSGIFSDFEFEGLDAELAERGLGDE